MVLKYITALLFTASWMNLMAEDTATSIEAEDAKILDVDLDMVAEVNVIFVTPDVDFVLAEASATVELYPIALGQDKFLGSAYAPVSPNFNWYWNQITPENAGKWGSVERSRDIMNWSVMDQTYNLGKENDMYVKFHVLVWGSQQPDWIESLTPAEQLEEIREWFTAVAERYPDLDAIEVVNEPLHQPPDVTHEGKYIEALGGSGETGWDWLITSFEMAREIFPETVKLMINDYGIVADNNATTQYLEIINLLQSRGLLDQIGVQGHAFNMNEANPSTVTANLNRLGNTGLPVYVTELDIDGFDDYLQLTRYQRIFPALWENEQVEGITLWGYAANAHWRADQGAYLINPDGSRRPSFIWLRAYVEGNFVPVSQVEVTSESNLTTIEEPTGTLQLDTNLIPGEATLTNIKWSSNDTDVAVVDENGVVTAIGNGTVTITATAQDGSKSSGTFTIEVTGQEVVTDIEKGQSFGIFPNPSPNGFLEFSGLTVNTKIRVYSLMGRVVSTYSTRDISNKLKILNPGIYMIRFNHQNSPVVRKIIIE